MVTYLCTAQAFRPCRVDGLRWWLAGEWEQAQRAHEGMWPDCSYWSREEWDGLYAEGYQYCALLRDGRSVAAAGLWPRLEEEWEVIAVGTAPAHRRQAHGRAIVSFATETILETGRVAAIGFRENNTPMLRIARALGYAPGPEQPG